MGEASPWAAYTLRLALAATFLLAGLDHAVDDGGMAWAVRWFPWPEPAGQAVAWGEVLAGLGLAAGALTAYAAGAAGFIALGAAATVLVEGDGFVWQNLLMAGAALYVIAHGPGPGSVDVWLLQRRPGWARWVRPTKGTSRRWGTLGFQVGLAGGLLGVFALAAAEGTWTSASAARVSPLLGPLVFWLRPLAGLLVLVGVAPRAAGLLLLLFGAVHAAPAPFEYHGFLLVGAGVALLLWPGSFDLRSAIPRAAKPEAPSEDTDEASARTFAALRRALGSR